MPSGGKRKNVRKAKAPVKPGAKNREWVGKMWSKYSEEYWEKELINGKDKAHEMIFRRMHPEVAKTVIAGDESDGPIRIILKGM